jgi:ribosomal protein S12 methylthiotransferase accessory factor
MTDRIGLMGAGLLHDTIAGALGDRATTGSLENSAGNVAMLVVASDAWDASPRAAARAWAARGSIPWLPVWTELGHAVIGPLEVPGEAGCVNCALARRRRLRADRDEWVALRRRHRDSLAARPSTLLTGLAADLVAALVAEDTDRVAAGAPPRTRRAVHRVRLADLNLTRHRFLPDPACPVCGDLPEDSAELARVSLRPRPAHAPGSYRTRSLRGELPRLMDTYVDNEAGLIRSLDGWSAGAQVFTAAPLGWRGDGGTTAGYGGAGTFQESRLVAVLEALERYAGTPGGRRTVVEGTYRELAGDALDPRELGLYPPQRYQLPGFPFAPFSPDRRYRWVWGWSFARAAPILVPEQCAYYAVPRRRGDPPGFVHENSNGCALGGSLEEAILHGVLEVAERDAFLLAWYARLPAPRIDLATARDRTVPLLAAAIETETGYQVLAFDISTEQRIPCIWAMACHPSSVPALACAAGAHPDPTSALVRALRELGTSLAALVRRCQDPENVRRAFAMAADRTQVQEMEDHALRYADPGAAAGLAFLTGSTAMRPAGEVGGAEPGGFASDDLRDNLQEAVSRYTDLGMDVIVVDQTAPEHVAGGFSCVKVLIPGTLPMTFGHQFRRVDGLPRLYRVPALLGYRDRPLRPDEVNPDPHPFP